MEKILNRITVDERICNGRPTVRGMGITVKTVLEYLLAGDSEEEILYQYPDLEAEDLAACRAFALAVADSKHTLHDLAA